MHDLDSPPPSADERPIAVRRKRRSSSGLNAQTQAQVSATRSHGISTPPQTPKGSKKRVRFSDPGPSIDAEPVSSGLTPFIRRTTLSTPTRRHSTPARLWNLAPDAAPICGTLQFEPLRQVLEGRVKRRLRRNKLSEEVNDIEFDKRQDAKARKIEVQRLREELAAKDIEMRSMQDEQELASQIEGESGISLHTSSTLSTKVRELEQTIRDLKAELGRREVDETRDPDWTTAARDPYHCDEYDDINVNTNYDDHEFTNGLDDDEVIMSTPTRLRTSFPSPPSTMPNTPCKATSVANAGSRQATLPDIEAEALQTQLQSLQAEILNLTSSIAFTEDNNTRLISKLAEFIPIIDESADHSTLDTALDTVLTNLALAQSNALEKETAFSALSNEVTALGFSTSHNPEETISTIAAQFRQARLDLEYLTPGEVVEGFENNKLLEMLISRICVLVKKVKESDDSIDQYHSQELHLRAEVNARVDGFRAMEKELGRANELAGLLRDEIGEKEVGNSRLQTALEGYRAEVAGLEKLIERVEQEATEKEIIMTGEVKEAEERLQDEILKHDTTRATEEGNQILIVQLERRLSAALEAAAEVQEQISELTSSHAKSSMELETTIEQLKSASTEREKQHGEALAIRDARVAELRIEIQRVNDVFKSAHTTIVGLRNSNQQLSAQLEDERTRGQTVVQEMREQLSRVLDTGMGYINGDVPREGSCPPLFTSTFGTGQRRRESSAPAEVAGIMVRTSLFDPTLARRASKGKKRRRYDSGLGFLEEEGDEDLVMGEM